MLTGSRLLAEQVSAASLPADQRSLSTVRIVIAVVALALGGFAIGTTEFVTMGVLPDIAADVGVDIPTAGHLISAYALGVVVGAPVIAALGARLPRRTLLVGLMAAFLVGNLLTVAAPGYRTMMVARFLSGLPHGAYFGVASLVAASLVAPRLRGRAVSSVLLGLSAAMLTGVPAATWLGQQLGWRSAYWTVVVLAALTVGRSWPWCRRPPAGVRPPSAASSAPSGGRR
jgi:MFS transporter, DHA1 family, inner membrane transport protein